MRWKNWLIKKLGGYTEKERFTRTVQFVREEVPIQTFKIARLGDYGEFRSEIEWFVKKELAEQLVATHPSPIKIIRSRFDDHTEEYIAEIKVCMPTEDKR